MLSSAYIISKKRQCVSFGWNHRSLCKTCKLISYW